MRVGLRTGKAGLNYHLEIVLDVREERFYD